ncbi:MAG: DUF5615 family PIN-like protein [Nitrospira sp.]|nr:DUF5615 family PIN-like protein [Nitrospira sp.]
MTIKLYIDEDVPVQLAKAMQQRGMDVLTTQEAQMIESSDEQQLAFAITQQRSILTHNKRDFIVIHKAYLNCGKEHSWIIVADRNKVGQLLRMISKLCFTLSSEDMKNRLEFLGSWR